MPSVKIAIDIRRMTEFGVGTYIRNVVRTLGRLDRENKYLLIGPPLKVQEIGALPPNFHTIPLTSAERSVRGYREFRAVVKRLECDLLHVPNPFSIPRALPCPYVLTVHDLLEHMERARDRNGFWRTFHFQLTRRVLRGAARIFAVSNFTRNEIEKRFGIPSARIEVVCPRGWRRLRRGVACPYCSSAACAWNVAPVPRYTACTSGSARTAVGSPCAMMRPRAMTNTRRA